MAPADALCPGFRTLAAAATGRVCLHLQRRQHRFPVAADGRRQRRLREVLERLSELVERRAATAMVEGAPPFQIGDGYDYDPLSKMPPSTLEFAANGLAYSRDL